MGLGGVAEWEVLADLDLQSRADHVEQRACQLYPVVARGGVIEQRRAGRVRKIDPARISANGSTGGTGPLVLPKTTSIPRLATLASEAAQLAAPTPSNTTLTP